MRAGRECGIKRSWSAAAAAALTGLVVATGACGGGGAGPHLPSAKGPCPTIQTGMLTFAGQPVQIWAGTPAAGQHGPLVVYWFATFSSSAEAVTGLGQDAIDEITAEGGVVAAPAATSGQGTNTGDGVWFTGDFDTADEVVACARAQLQIDPQRIFAAGFSAGGLQTTWMSYARSDYLASAVTYSGGLTAVGNTVLDPVTMPQDPSNVPAAMAVHGAAGSDVVILDFSATSAAWEADVQKKGGFAIDCDHGGGHMIPAGIAPSTWQFMKDHPFRVRPEPYAAGIPASFPSYCRIP